MRQAERTTLNVNQSPLPVEFLYFEAELNRKSAQLNWATASETNNDFFLVQRSADGDQWEDIERVEGQGNSPDLTRYETEDPEVYEVEGEYVFYRLKQVDFDDSYEYSSIAHVEKEPIEEPDFAVHPNPFEDELSVGFEMNRKGWVQATIYNLQGKELALLSERFNIGNHEWRLEENLQDLAPGSYMIMLQTGDGQNREVFHLIKQ